jgi:RNA polymerase sigma-70 factor, ECF subfamily
MTESQTTYQPTDCMQTRQDFETLYSRYAPAMYGILIKIVSNETVAEDLLQDVFVKVWKNRANYNQAKGTLFTWLLNITRNTGIDYLRSKQHKQQRNTVTVLDDNIAAAESNRETVTDARKLVNSIDEKHRQVLELIFLKGYSQSETAMLLNIPVGTVKTRARNAINILRKLNNDAG